MLLTTCLLYTSDAADEEDSVDLGGRRIIKKIVIIIVHSRFSEWFDVFLIIQMSFWATLGSKRAL